MAAELLAHHGPEEFLGGWEAVGVGPVARCQGVGGH